MRSFNRGSPDMRPVILTPGGIFTNMVTVTMIITTLAASIAMKTVYKSAKTSIGAIAPLMCGTK